jgi:hypothetical protein
MPTLTTQSIGIEGTRLIAPQNQGGAAGRLVQASSTSGIQDAQQRRQAQRSATQTQRDDQRTIDRKEKRTEGSFTNQPRPKQQEDGQDSGEGKRLNTVA